jgi:Flagellar biosynthesis pathway, component FlhB
LIVLALLLAPLLLRGWVFAPRALAFDARRLDPLAALRRLFSADGAFAIVRSLLKFALVAAVCRLTLVREFGGLLPGAAASPPLTTALAVVFHGLLAVVGTLALFAFADAAWNWWRYRVRHAMSWQEVLAEARESEGSPAMRARVRQRQQAVGQVGNDPLALAGANAKPAAVKA